MLLLFAFAIKANKRLLRNVYSYWNGMRFATVEAGFCNFLLSPKSLGIKKADFLSQNCAKSLIAGGHKHMNDKKSRDVEPSELKLDANKRLSGDAAEDIRFDPQVMEAFLKFLETELIDPAADVSVNEPDDLLDEPTNGWPGYPFL